MSKLRKDIEALALSKRKVKGRRQKLNSGSVADRVLDYDPEDENGANQDDFADDTEDEEIPFGDREHYQAVGKSKLRKPESAPLDPKYGGVAVSRKALDIDSDEDEPLVSGDDGDEDDDPFAVDADDSEDQSNDVAANRAGLSRSPALDDATDDEVSEGEEVDEGAEDDDEEDLNDNSVDIEDLDEDEEEESDESDSQSDSGVAGARGDLRALLSNDSKALAQGLSQAAIADAAKGRAVKRQYQNFDRILDARMKLQKGLAASGELLNQIGTTDFTSDAREALLAAQESARQVFNTISSFRDSIASATPLSVPSKKRKRSTYMKGVEDLDSVWQTLNQSEKDSAPGRRAIIDKWSSREKAFDSTLASTRPKQRLQETSGQQDQLTAVLDVYVANEQEKHFRGEDEEPEAFEHQASKFDDSIFYQSLLRDLITSRSATSSVANNLSGALLPHKLHPSGNRENKKIIDTKASKGRKIRYTVHEKLQNFMAAEGDTGRDTAMWTERGKNEFFGSLFGQDRALAEDLSAGEEGDEAEVKALRLFRG